MIVRDLTLKKSDYKGHPCYAVDKICPCRPCYNAHDCTPPNPAYSRKVYSDTFHCASNWNTGCPQPKPEPNHMLNRQHRCKRCGQVVRPNSKPSDGEILTIEGLPRDGDKTWVATAKAVDDYFSGDKGQ